MGFDVILKIFFGLHIFSIRQSCYELTVINPRLFFKIFRILKDMISQEVVLNPLIVLRQPFITRSLYEYRMKDESGFEKSKKSLGDAPGEGTLRFDSFFMA